MADSQKKLPTVPETLLKKRKQNAEFRAKRAKAVLLNKKQNREKRKVMFKRAEKYVKEYRVMERDQIRLARQAKKHGNFYVPPQPKLALVIRIRGINGIHPRPRKVLQLFRLRQINNGVFVKLSKDILCMEDLIHEVFTVGSSFKSASNFLWPFKLNTPNGGWRRKYNHFNDGGDFGFRDDKINALLRKMI